MFLSILNSRRGERRNNQYRHINLCRNARFIRSLKTHVKSVDFLAPLNIWMLEVWTMGCSLRKISSSHFDVNWVFELLLYDMQEDFSSWTVFRKSSIVIYSITTSRKILGELWISYYKRYWRGVEIMRTRWTKIPEMEEPFVGGKRIANICCFWTQAREKG